jgi:hypothetical protein
MTGQLVSVAEITPGQRAEMFALMEAYYENAERATFEADLAEKDWVILVLDEHTNRLQGFSTQMLIPLEFGGRTIRALFSGDTIVDRAARGQRSLFRVSGWFLRSLLNAHPHDELYWFLISKGYKTYRFLPLFFHEFYPRHDVPTPPRVAAVIDALATHKFLAAYDGAAGIVRAAPDSCRLRLGVADISAERMSDPHVRFFAECNPRHADGDELCCLAPVTLENFTPAANRAMGAEPQPLLAFR